MEPWARLVRFVRSLIGRGPIDRDLDAEVDTYVEMLVEEKLAAGVPAEEARRLARLEAGGAEQTKEAVRDVRPAAWLDQGLRDLRLGLRQLAKAPTFSVTVVLVLALGIGANVAVFGLVNVLLLQPRPGVGAPGSLVALHVHDPRQPESYRRFSYADYDWLRHQAELFTDLAAHRDIRAIVSDGEQARATLVGEVTASYFPTLRSRLSLGRSFTEEEERPGSQAAVAVISHAAWHELGGQPSVLGRVLTLNSRPFTIVGVAAEGFTGTMAAFGPEMWIPVGADSLLREPAERPTSSTGGVSRDARYLSIVARTRPRTLLPALNAELEVVSSRLPNGAGASEVLTANPLARTEDSETPEDDSGLYAPLATLAGMAALLLLVASLNAANIQLARGASRRKEIATRLALGAGRGRIVVQLLLESLLLTLAAGVVGLLLGDWALKLAGASFAPLIDGALVVPSAPDVRVIIATAFFCVASALVSALAPALRLSKLNVLQDLKGRGDAGAGGRGCRTGPRNAAVAWQMALSLALLATAGLFVRAAVAARQADPGYAVDGQILMVVDAPSLTRLESREAYAALLERVRSVRGVERASPATLVAFGNSHSSRLVAAAGTSGAAPAAGVSAQNYAVGAGYFATLALPLLAGREFSDAEERGPSAPAVAIIDEPLARALFPGQDPVGRFILLPAVQRESESESLQVVGLVAGQRERLTDQAPVSHIYRPLGSQDQRQLNVHVRVAGASWPARSNVLSGLRSAVKASGGRLALLAASPLRDAHSRVPLNWLVRAAGLAFGALGIVGLVMAVIGLYGVKAYLVAQRTREIGIRVALGATPRGVVSLVMRDGSRTLAVGLLAGLLLAVGAGLLVSRLLVGVRPLDPVVFPLSTAVLLLAVAAASYVPARRAMRIDPAVAMRAE